MVQSLREGGLQPLDNKALSWGRIGKSAPVLAEITIRKSQLLDRHPSFAQCRRHRVPEEMRIYPLGDLCLLRRFLPNLLDASGVSSAWHDGHVATLPAFGLRHQDHLLIKKHILRFEVHKLRDSCPRLKQGL